MNQSTNKSHRIDWSNPDLRTLLTPTASKLYNLSDFVQSDLNLYSLINYSDLTANIAGALKPRSICEIGIEKGNNSAFLIDLASHHDASVTCVDPTADVEFLEKLGQDAGVTVHVVRKKSQEYFPDAPMHDLYVIDGDHNYETVSTELAMIRRSLQAGGIAILHDVGWPLGYRNMYYEPSADLADHVRGKLSPFDKTVSDYGLPMDFALSPKEDGEANGVRKALEDFADVFPSVDYSIIPLFYGFGILWDKLAATVPVRSKMAEIRSSISLLGKTLALAELNRVMLLIRLEDAGIFWKNQKEYIEALERKLSALRAEYNVQE